MIGNNKLELNTATMIQAIQEWLDRKMPTGSPLVTNVEAGDSNSYSKTFIVYLDDRKESLVKP